MIRKYTIGLGLTNGRPTFGICWVNSNYGIGNDIGYTSKTKAINAAERIIEECDTNK